MKKLPATLLAAAIAATLAHAAPIRPGTPYTLDEIRGYATLERTLDRLGIELARQYHPEEAPVYSFLRDRDIADTTLNFDPFASASPVHFLSLSPADRQAFLDLLAAESWSNEPDTPEGWQVFVPPTAPFRYYIASADRKTAFSKDPDALRAALDLYPSIPALLPAEGDLVKQYRPDFLKPSRGTPFLTPDVISLFRRHVDTVTAGLGIDADTLALQAVLTPLPASKLADLLASCGPIPPSTACVNLPGAIACLAFGTAPTPDANLPLSPLPFSGLENWCDRFNVNQPSSAALYPPAAPGALPRALAFTGLNDLPEARTALLDLLARHADAIALASPSPHRNIAIDTLSIASPDALAALLETAGLTPYTARARSNFAAALSPISLAWLPDGLLVAVNDDASALLSAAIDAALDGTATPFESTPAFRAAYPYPDGPAFAIAHLDLPALLDLLPWKLEFKDEPLPTPCPIDLFAYIASDASLVTRLRAPASLLKAIKHGSISGGAGGSPAISEAAPSGVSPSGGASSGGAGGWGAAPPSFANPSPSPDGGPSARQTTPLSPTPFMGYPEAYVLSNAHLHAVVVPAISRLAFLAPSADSPNLLRFDTALAEAGATPPDPSTAPDFFNIGGDWVWPVAQSNWPAFSPNASDWPPPPALADAPSDAEAWVDEDGNQHVLLTRHYPAPVHAILTREFILDPIRHLFCGQTLTRDSDAPADALPLTLWHISQVANPDKIRLTAPTPGFTPTVLAGTLLPGSFVVESEWHGTFIGGTPLGRPATYTPPPSSEVKLLLPTISLTARTPNGNFTVTVSNPTWDTHTELYSNTSLGYAQLETVTPDSSFVPHVSPIADTLSYFVHPTY